MLSRSGTEEEYSELHQLIEDISSYREDFLEKKEEENRAAMLKRERDKQRGEEMRDAATRSLSGEIYMSSTIIIIKKYTFFTKEKRGSESDDEGSPIKKRRGMWYA